ncbi:hypothetical protein STENM223S_10961 [Streptomyces tendae]
MSVVRSMVQSWELTSLPSLVRWTSISTWSARWRTARSMAAAVFSGAMPEEPRWAMTSGPVAACAPVDGNASTRPLTSAATTPARLLLTNFMEPPGFE